MIAVATPAPVFVDSTGRRSRLLRRIALAFGVLVVSYGGLVSVSLAGGPVRSSAVLPLPGIDNTEDKVDPAPPRPSPVAGPGPSAAPSRPVESTERPARHPAAPGPARPAATATRHPGRTTTTRPAAGKPSASPSASASKPVESTSTPPVKPSSAPPVAAPAPPVESAAALGRDSSEPGPSPSEVQA
ncbi:Filamentous hemagglutinin [Actinoplanes sp. SE50/110]|nr:Filamentous hemagglutinin [Actinoplanes sp. SE50/110]SLM04504.1 hypothetical protein ACSP50_7810 [Actinoplanes sp. SE50/110]